METITADKDALEQKAADLISKRLRTTDKKRIIVGIPGGRSVQGLFAKLVEANIDWQKVHLFWVDERCVPLDSDDSNYNAAHDTLLEPLIDSKKFPKENIHSYSHSDDNPNEALTDYNNEFRAIGAAFDILILGAGEDGHIASLFPNHEGMRDNSEGFISITDSPKPPKDRVTASKELIAKTDTAFILFLGEGKKDALKKFLDPDLTINDCPAKLAQLAKHCFLLTDQKITTNK